MPAMSNSSPRPLSRSDKGKWFGGVCVGLARGRDIPVASARAAFVVAALIGGLGVLAYLTCWLIIPHEGEQPGELTAIGDRPLDSAGEELVAAAREALRNAARYAGGAPVFVFAETTVTGVGVVVRDEGPGFDLEAVPPERRGIRDAIVGRMASAGGVATIESGPGEGTEVALRLCPGRKAAR
jgi:phage shock protein PspC (stress-responsive transcriptional regulator)